MKFVLYTYFIFALAFFLSACFVPNFQTPEELCHEAIVDCVNGIPEFQEGRCRCQCDEGSELVAVGAPGISFPFGICRCSEEPPCLPGFVKASDLGCDCFPKILEDLKGNPYAKANQPVEDDYFPLQPDLVLIYNTLNAMGIANGQFGFIFVDTLSVYMVDDSVNLAVPVTLYFLGMVIPDSTGMLSDTVIGPTVHNLPENPNMVVYSSGTNSAFVGFHHFTPGDSIPDEDGFVYFENIGTVTVPAGTFDNCIFVRDEDNSGNVYAPDVGLIKIVAEGVDAVVLDQYSGGNTGTDCDGDVIQITDPIADDTHLKASDHIIVSSAVQANAGVTLQALNFLQMNPGFSVPLGAVVNLIIAACEDH